MRNEMNNRGLEWLTNIDKYRCEAEKQFAPLASLYDRKVMVHNATNSNCITISTYILIQCFYLWTACMLCFMLCCWLLLTTLKRFTLVHTEITIEGVFCRNKWIASFVQSFERFPTFSLKLVLKIYPLQLPTPKIVPNELWLPFVWSVWFAIDTV